MKKENAVRFLVLWLLFVSSSVFAHWSSHAESCTYTQRGIALVSDCVKEGKYYQRIDSDFYTEHRQIERLKEQVVSEQSTSKFLFVVCLVLFVVLVWILILLFDATTGKDTP